MKTIKKRLHVLILFISMPVMLSAQLTYGTTGLLHTPSAEMQKDKTVILGANFLNKELTPPTWYYDTYNYYLNATIMPWLEVAYTCTLFKAESLGLAPYGYTGFTNQDRYFSLKLRVLKEGQFWKHMPAIALGTSDPYTESGGDNGQISSAEGNGYFCRFYIATTKHLSLGKEQIGIHLAYLFNHRKDYPLNGIAAGISYQPSFHQSLKLIAEYDTKSFALGATYLLFNHLHAQIEWQNIRHFSGGLAFQFNLK